MNISANDDSHAGLSSCAQPTLAHTLTPTPLTPSLASPPPSLPPHCTTPPPSPLPPPPSPPPSPSPLSHPVHDGRHWKNCHEGEGEGRRRRGEETCDTYMYFQFLRQALLLNCYIKVYMYSVGWAWAEPSDCCLGCTYIQEGIVCLLYNRCSIGKARSHQECKRVICTAEWY